MIGVIVKLYLKYQRSYKLDEAPVNTYLLWIKILIWVFPSDIVVRKPILIWPEITPPKFGQEFNAPLIRKRDLHWEETFSSNNYQKRFRNRSYIFDYLSAIKTHFLNTNIKLLPKQNWDITPQMIQYYLWLMGLDDDTNLYPRESFQMWV